MFLLIRRQVMATRARPTLSNAGLDLALRRLKYQQQDYVVKRAGTLSFSWNSWVRTNIHPAEVSSS